MATRQSATPKAPALPPSEWEGAVPTDAEDSGFGSGVVPADNYIVQIEKAYFRTGTSGVPYINLELPIIDGQHTGRYVFLPLYINSQSEPFRKGQKGFLAKVYEVVTGELPASFPTTDEDLAPLVNGEMMVKVIIEEQERLDGNGMEDINRVTRAFSIDGQTQQTTPPAATIPARQRRAAPVAAPEHTWEAIHAMTDDVIERDVIAPNPALTDAAIDHAYDTLAEDASLADAVCAALGLQKPVANRQRRGAQPQTPATPPARPQRPNAAGSATATRTVKPNAFKDMQDDIPY
jgi:hypothetical protein